MALTAYMASVSKQGIASAFHSGRFATNGAWLAVLGSGMGPTDKVDSAVISFYLLCSSGIRYRRFPGELPANSLNPLGIQPEGLSHHVVDLLAGRIDSHLGEGLQYLILETVEGLPQQSPSFQVCQGRREVGPVGCRCSGGVSQRQAGSRLGG